MVGVRQISVRLLELAGSTTQTERSVQLFGDGRTGSGTEKVADCSIQKRDGMAEQGDTTYSTDIENSLSGSLFSTLYKNTA